MEAEGNQSSASEVSWLMIPLKESIVPTLSSFSHPPLQRTPPSGGSPYGQSGGVFLHKDLHEDLVKINCISNAQFNRKMLLFSRLLTTLGMGRGAMRVASCWCNGLIA